MPALIADGVEVFKVHVQVGDFAPNDPLLEPVWGALAESETPIVLHAGSGPAPGAHTGPAGVADVLSRHPDLALIIAHLGMPEIDEFCDLAEKYENVRLDTTMAFVDFWGQPVPDGIIPRLRTLQDKILFGTDFPNIPYAYAHQVEVLQRLDLGDDWMRQVLWSNAAELFRRRLVRHRAVSQAGTIRLATPQGVWLLAAMILGSGMAFLDGSIVGLALPAMNADLDAGAAGVQWIVNAYTLTLAALILVGGSLGDRLGRRRVYVIGVAWFAVASVLCAVAPTIGVLVFARGLQGVGAALLTPGSLAIISAVFASEDRGKAIGAWSGLSGVTTAIGPLVGGALVDSVGWRSIFWLNIPLAAVVIWLTVRHVPETSGDQGKIDYAGAGLTAAGLAALTYGLVDGSWVWGAAGVVLMVVFVVHQKLTPHALVPLGLFADRVFTAANICTFAIYGALAASGFLLVQQLQYVSGFSPARSWPLDRSDDDHHAVVLGQGRRAGIAHRSATADDGRSADRCGGSGDDAPHRRRGKHVDRRPARLDHVRRRHHGAGCAADDGGAGRGSDGADRHRVGHQRCCRPHGVLVGRGGDPADRWDRRIELR
ncbi:MFS transporter [Aeromicrobium sp. UC242_57]|uniref:MFS transporter n=1 Tax=Aeromicrobium sp. UC242_57 TaxID=3374624 RepID=UPI0037ACEA7E